MKSSPPRLSGKDQVQHSAAAGRIQARPRFLQQKAKVATKGAPILRSVGGSVYAMARPRAFGTTWFAGDCVALTLAPDQSATGGGTPRVHHHSATLAIRPLPLAMLRPQSAGNSSAPRTGGHAANSTRPRHPPIRNAGGTSPPKTRADSPGHGNQTSRLPRSDPSSVSFEVARCALVAATAAVLSRDCRALMMARCSPMAAALRWRSSCLSH